ncbi:hypothetical protein T11_4452 [Trichinella zimbabwensis]|uniref:Uncharacterized protein n=1 Tax=Trichinella zimbabwensis TaxID=268475 RepID=A0A0V1GVU2_9BILA|nr:hypothetical protein T11_4452 [Trichinella zimbabwensis]
MDKYSAKKEPDELGNSSSNSSREEILLFYERTNMLYFFSGLALAFHYWYMVLAISRHHCNAI